MINIVDFEKEFRTCQNSNVVSTELKNHIFEIVQSQGRKKKYSVKYDYLVFIKTIEPKMMYAFNPERGELYPYISQIILGYFGWYSLFFHKMLNK